MKALALDERRKFGLSTPRVMKSDLRRIYKQYQIHIDLWQFPLKEVRGAYFNDQLGTSVLLNATLPDDPRIFTMAHELKHHLVDRELSLIYCGRSNELEPIEIGAEVFAAEFIFPEQDYADLLKMMGINKENFTPEALIHLKHNTKTTLSYSGLAKRAEFMGFAKEGSLTKIRIPWKKIEEKIFGTPIYKQIQKHRKIYRKAS